MKNSVKRMNLIGFALVSSNRNRILFFNKDYEVTKRLQLYYMRNDLLYLAPLDRFMLQKHLLASRQDPSLPEFNEQNCMEFTLNNATILPVEMDVAPFRFSRIQIDTTLSKPKPEEYNIHLNLQHASTVIEEVEELVDRRIQHAMDDAQYILKGYEMFHKFCRENLTAGESIDYMFKKDIEDELQFKNTFLDIKRNITEKIMGLDYTIDPTLFREQLKQDILSVHETNPNKYSDMITKRMHTL